MWGNSIQLCLCVLHSGRVRGTIRRRQANYHSMEAAAASTYLNHRLADPPITPPPEKVKPGVKSLCLCVCDAGLILIKKPEVCPEHGLVELPHAWAEDCVIDVPGTALLLQRTRCRKLCCSARKPWWWTLLQDGHGQAMVAHVHVCAAA